MVTITEFQELAKSSTWVRIAKIGKNEIFLRHDKKELLVDNGCNIYAAYYDNTGIKDCLRWDSTMSENITNRLLGMARRLKMISIYE